MSPKQYTEEDCVEALREAAEKLGHSPTLDEYRDLNKSPSFLTIARRLGGGSWSEAKRNIGFKAYRDNRGPSVRINTQGYPVVSVANPGDGPTIKEMRIHRLVAVSEYGIDAVKDKHVHHKNGVRWDNRPSNLEPLTPEEHRKSHAENDD